MFNVVSNVFNISAAFGSLLLVDVRERNPWLRIVKDKIKERGGIAVTSSSVQESPSAPGAVDPLATLAISAPGSAGLHCLQLVAPECLN